MIRDYNVCGEGNAIADDSIAGKICKTGQIRPKLSGVAQTKLKHLPHYQRLKREGLSEKEIIIELKKPALKRIFTWKGEKEVEISTYDSLLHHLQFLQAGFLAMNPRAGRLRSG